MPVRARSCGGPKPRTRNLNDMSDGGTVYLVGAGPGDPGLATRRALDLIARADVIVHDRLVHPSLLDAASADAELLYAGKQPGGSSISQAEINELLVEHARRGRLVVRLKGGDPFVFGRGGEEAEALAEAGIRFQVVPGVTAGVAAPACAGIPVTHRDAASAVAFITGHEDPSKDGSALDWPALAAFPGTLVFYMGVRNLALVAERLIENGRAPDEPAAIIERGSFADQRAVTAPLSAIAEIAGAEGIDAPAVTVIGPVAALRERLAWLEHLPLHGFSVVVTRARAQASSLAGRLRELGATVIEAPTIRIESRVADTSISEAVKRIAAGGYDVVCLTSPNGAEFMLEAIGRAGLDARALAGTTLASIGPGTTRALRRGGLEADLVPAQSVSEALADELTGSGVAGKRVLLARAAEARDVLPDRLREAGAEVDVVALYQTVRERPSDEVLAKVAEADYVTFTSSSTVRYFVEAAGVDNLPARARMISIGPVTSRAARDLGLEISAEASRHDIDGLVEALTEDALARIASERR
jgi:uroporphyrinogen III methyltransferase / synthase